jgi:hypothetical protein
MKRLMAIAALAAGALVSFGDEDVAVLLQRQTQELFDALTSGSKQAWDRYLDDMATYTDDGDTMHGRFKFGGR